MTLAATGPMSLPFENLRTLLAASATFQAWVGAASAAAAKARIYISAKSGPTRPYAMIDVGENFKLTHNTIAGGTRNAFLDNGALELKFEADVSESYQASPEETLFEFTNKVGAILSEMEALAASGGYLDLRRWETIDGPGLANPDEKSSSGQYMGVWLRIEWGLGEAQ